MTYFPWYSIFNKFFSSIAEQRECGDFGYKKWQKASGRILQWNLFFFFNSKKNKVKKCVGADYALKNFALFNKTLQERNITIFNINKYQFKIYEYFCFKWNLRRIKKFQKLFKVKNLIILTKNTKSIKNSKRKIYI